MIESRWRGDLEEPGFAAGQGPLGHLVRLEWEHSRSFIPLWQARYEAAVLAGEIGLEESVERFLADFRSGVKGSSIR